MHGLRYAYRRFRTHWRLILTAVLSLGVAMTATIAGVGVVNAVMVRPPGVDAPAEVQSLFVRAPDEPFGSVSFEEYRYFRDHNTVFTGVAAFPQMIAGLTADRRHRDRDCRAHADRRLRERHQSPPRPRDDPST